MHQHVSYGTNKTLITALNFERSVSARAHAQVSNMHRAKIHLIAPHGRYNSSTVLYVYIIDQARGQDGWILAEFSFCVFMDRDEVEVHKNAKRKRGQYPAILTELAWLITDLLYGVKSTEKNDLRTCLFSSNEKETI